jgi:hypothetical protein
MIWLALAIPLITVVILYLGFKQRVIWWEVLIPLTVTIALILAFKLTSERFHVSDTEYWTGWLIKAEYYEPWTEEYLDTYIDADGDLQTRWVTDYHPARWCMTDNNDIEISISKQKYRGLVARLGGEKEVDLSHGNQTSIGDGDKWIAEWNGDKKTAIPLTTIHNYENRVQVSRSVFNFPKVAPEDKEAYGLFEYPEIEDETKVPSILGSGGPTMAEANKLLSRRNAELGRSKQVRMWILVFKNQPVDAAIQQESYWKGGNKNEFTLCLSVDDKHKVEWAYVFSWTEKERLKVDTRMFAQDQETLDLNTTVQYMSNEVEKRFVRKQFADFNYLSIQTPTWAIVTTFVVTIAVCIGLGFFIVLNPYDADGPRRYRFRYGRAWKY